jgi:TolA-binding protein
LDRGWCGWLAGDYAECLADFQGAVAKLPPSEDLAVARFKLADTFFARGDYADALNNYQEVLHLTNDFPQVLPVLGDRALYQSLRAQLNLGDLTGASGSMARIAGAYPESELRQSSALLLGEGYTDLRQPANALKVFANFLDQVPHSPLRSSVELAVARAYEQEQNWLAASAQYDRWLAEFPTNNLLPQAKYSRAWASFQAGDETNALMLFTNFIVQFPTNELAPMAQWWVADHYFRLGDSVNAERNYKSIFQNTNWVNSPLFYPAQLMAGRAAVSRTDDAEAIRDYFEKLEGDTNCPLDLRVQATFLHGSALMKMDSPDTNNPTSNFSVAVTVLHTICESFPTNETGARAWGLIGNCYLQLSRYNDATNAYRQAINYAGTNVSLQSQAQIGLGIVLEKMAALLPAGSNQTALLNQAEASYWDVLQDAKQNANGGGQDLFWTKEAGLKAADLAVGSGKWEDATNFYGELLHLMPELQDLLARKIETANQHLNALKK